MMLRDERGSVAIIFALLAVPLTAFIGLAVGYGHMTLQETRLQNALDNAARSAGRNYQVTGLDGQSETLARGLITANAPAGTRLDFGISYNADGSKSYVLLGELDQPLYFLAVLPGAPVKLTIRRRAAATFMQRGS